jgi:hypothetical protein
MKSYWILEKQMRAKKAFQIAVMGLLVICFAASAKSLPLQVQPNVPHWAGLPTDTSADLRAEGIYAGKYERLLQGEVLTESRPVPAGKSGVHVAAFGTIRGSVDKLWRVVDDCGTSPPVMPYLQSCRVVEPDHPLPPNRRWEQLKINFRILLFSSNVTLVNEKTIEAPNYLRWKQVRGNAKVNEGYFRIISITPDTQLVVYDELVDPAPASLPGFIKRWIIEQCLPELITSLRDHV